MFGIETLTGTVQAVVLVGIVLVEAVVLYVVYGALETALGGRIRGILAGQCPVVDAVFGGCVAEGVDR